MAINDRIKQLGSYFRNMQVDTIDGQQIIYVIVRFPPRWLIDESVEEKYNVSIRRRGDDFYFCADIEEGFDTVFDAIEFSIEKMVTAQERANLLKVKIEELREMFEDESISIESLRNIEFTFSGGGTTVPQKRKRKVKKNGKEQGKITTTSAFIATSI